MKSLLLLFFLCSLGLAEEKAENTTAEESAPIEAIANLTDPKKLATLKGERASNPRFQKCLYWLAVGDLVLTRTNGSNLVLNYDIEQSEDLQTWTTYQGYALPLTNLPTNKAFVRIKAKQ